MVEKKVFYTIHSRIILERFDHPPENDHCDKITAMAGCSKLKLVATGSFDGTIRIWNGKNQLIRFDIIELKTNKHLLFLIEWLSFMIIFIHYISAMILEI